ncbi:MAG: DNA-processing protein DprA [Gammaproteobacteria bacterium]
MTSARIALRPPQDWWLALIRAPGVGPATALRLLRHFGDPAAVFAAGAAGWSAAGVPLALQQGLLAPDWAGVDQDLHWLGAGGRHLIPWTDERYPALLREIAQPPAALFVDGDPSLLARRQLAIVGARSATRQGAETAEAFAAELARCGLAITSGLALGIDGAAHRGALAVGGATLAVCGTGLDRVFPPRHRAQAREIAARGALVSEFPCGTPPLADHFPRRNRIISGLSLGVLVAEAAPRSGSLITARLAGEQGREVFAIPGSIHSPMSRGPHALIRQGAKLVESVHDILDELSAALGEGFARPRRPDAPAPELDPARRRVLDAVGFEPTGFDRLIERLAMPVDALSAALLTLELDGLIAAAPGGAYQRLAAGA